MKNFRTHLPALLLAGIFIYSCNSDQSPESKDYSKKSTVSKDNLVMADSVSSGFNAPYEEQETGPGNKYIAFRDASPRVDQVAVDAYYLDQTEINNNEYRSFVYLMRSTAARPTALDSTHKFVRTAEIKFRTKNVATSSYRVEDLAAKFGGYVADTKITSQLLSSYEKPVSPDSSLQTMRFVVTSAITLRVPVENLDTTLKSLVPMIDYLDYRYVNTKDITLDLLSNKLTQKRIFNYNTRLALAIDNKGKKLDDVQSAEQSILNQQENSDNAFIENLRQDDQVKYSTVVIYLYQKETIRQELIAREKNIAEYEPGMGSKMGEAFAGGWHGLQNIIMVIILLWPLWLITGGTLFLVRWLVRRNKRAKGKVLNN